MPDRRFGVAGAVLLLATAGEAFPGTVFLYDAHSGVRELGTLEGAARLRYSPESGQLDVETLSGEVWIAPGQRSLLRTSRRSTARETELDPAIVERIRAVRPEAGNIVATSGGAAFAWIEDRAALATVIRISAGATHTLAVASDGTVWQWGFAQAEFPPDSVPPVSMAPTQVPGLTNVTAVAAGGSFSVALRGDGTVWSWGGRLATTQSSGAPGSRMTPSQVPGLTSITAIAAGLSHALAVRSDGTAFAWGSNSSGQLGTGTRDIAISPLQVSSLTGVSAVAAGATFSYALKSDGTVWSWGANLFGQLGDGTTVDRLIPGQVPGLANITAIAAGEDHALVRVNDGTVRAWGLNAQGQLGDSTTATRLTPVLVPGLTGIAGVSAGGAHSMAFGANGALWIWGGNASLQLGETAVASRLSPVQLAGVTGVTAIAAGRNHSIVLRPGPLVQAWGSDTFGQLGRGIPIASPLPVRVNSLSGITAISSQWEHVLAAQSGQLYGWGANFAGHLGDGTQTNRSSPVAIPLPAPVKSIAAGHQHSLAALTNDTVWAWGANESGQVGDGTFLRRLAPVSLTSLNTVTTGVAAGALHSLRLGADGRVSAWGANSSGQTAGSSGSPQPSPTQIASLLNVTSVQASVFSSRAIRSDQSLWAWGAGWPGIAGASNTPAASSLSSVLATAGGLLHNLALKTDGSVWAWGGNAEGQLGIGSTTDQTTAAVKVPGLEGAVAIAAAGNHSLAVKRDGSVWSWGSNILGQLGNGTFANSLRPVPVAGLTSVVEVAAGAEFSVARKSDGTVWVWGGDTSGQLGQARNLSTAAPVNVVPAGTSDLAVAISHTGDFTVGVPASFLVTVTNISTTATSGNITFATTLPRGLGFLSGTGTGWGCSAAGRDVTCLRTTALAAGAATTVTLSVNVNRLARPAVTCGVTLTHAGDLNAGNNVTGDSANVLARSTKVGAYQNGVWILDQNGSFAWEGTTLDRLRSWTLGLPNEIPVVGDWNGDGSQKIGLYVNGTWLLDMNGNGTYEALIDKLLYFGGSGYKPFVGDWDGDGADNVGAYLNGSWILDWNGNFLWDGSAQDKLVFWSLGLPGEVPILGDWNGDGKIKLGLYVNGTMQLDFDGDGAWNASIDKLAYFGGPGYTPFVGDWSGKGSDSIGVYNSGGWILDWNGDFTWNGTTIDRLAFWSLALPGEQPIIGDWNANGQTKLGLYVNGTIQVDYDGNASWSLAADKLAFFGGPGQIPLTGRW